MLSQALALTAVLGIASYFVQAKFTRDTTAAQDRIERQTAERDKDVATAEKLLVRCRCKHTQHRL